MTSGETLGSWTNKVVIIQMTLFVLSKTQALKVEFYTTSLARNEKLDPSLPVTVRYASKR